MHRLAERFGLNHDHPEPVHAEVAELLKTPGIEDPALIDRTSLPFVTIDNEDSRDLDQALCVTRESRGWTLWYALADAAFYVRPGSALFAEALARGASFYLPGLSIPMLPRPLSEGLVSLNEAVDRRSLLFVIELGAAGEVKRVRIERARVRSRKKLTYAGVQRYFDAPEGDPIAGQEFTRSLECFAALGRVLLARAEARGAIGWAREHRTDVDRWNEQISLLTNIEGARFLLESHPSLQPIFRVHPAPEQERVAELSRRIDALVERRDRSIWRWRRESETLTEYLRRLPQAERLTKALQRQSMVIHQRSLFSEVPGHHHGIGADAYARFTSPMREIVGIFTHKEALEKLEGRPSSAEDEELRRRVIDSGNRAKDLQRQLEKEALKLEIDRLLENAVDRVFDGTIMGVGPDKVYVELDEPSIDVKIYTRDLGRFEMDTNGIELRSPDGENFRTGEAITVRVMGYEERRRRWKICPVDRPRPST